MLKFLRSGVLLLYAAVFYIGMSFYFTVGQQWELALLAQSLAWTFYLYFTYRLDRD